MARPCSIKEIKQDPEYTCFKPTNIPKFKLQRVEISSEEFEAYRLSNLEGLPNLVGAEKMKTSRATFNRLVNSANFKIADALVNGKGIRIYKRDGTHNCN